MELIRIDSIKPLSLTMADYVFSLLIGGLFGTFLVGVFWGFGITGMSAVFPSFLGGLAITAQAHYSALDSAKEKRKQSYANLLKPLEKGALVQYSISMELTEVERQIAIEVLNQQFPGWSLK